MTRTPFRLAAAAASALAIAILGFSSPVAQAEPTPSPSPVSQSTIDTIKDTSLTIHKYSGPANTTKACAPTGQPVDAACLAGKTPLAGAEFTIYKVMDLNTNADWEAAKASYAAGSYTPTSGSVAVVTTGTNGTVTAESLDVALYYVVETKTPTGYTGAVPFFVTLPMTDPDNTAWDYAIDVYPKNSPVEAPHKAAVDANTVKVGDKIDYTVTTKVPTYQDVVGAPDADGKYTKPDGTTDGWDVGSFT